jgi:hypothetical protein
MRKRKKADRAKLLASTQGKSVSTQSGEALRALTTLAVAAHYVADLGTQLRETADTLDHQMEVLSSCLGYDVLQDIRNPLVRAAKPRARHGK